MTKTTSKANGERAVVVTTEHRGVFFGYATDTDGAIIKLRAARNCIFWPVENKGFMGLAAMGPVQGARVGPAADISLRDITSVIEATEQAVKAWENAPWSR
jgi:hypothetical protein